MPTGPQAPTISRQDQDALALAYQHLLEVREVMIQSMNEREASPYRSGVFIDALINGLMAHFHEIARNSSAHAAELQAWGPTVIDYVNRLVQEARAVFTQAPSSTRGAPTKR